MRSALGHSASSQSADSVFREEEREVDKVTSNTAATERNLRCETVRALERKDFEGESESSSRRPCDSRSRAEGVGPRCAGATSSAN
ncbi:hypothetical protein AAFF_G00160780 [Aldrovandia affinis]|uniref:Uncharacterized protein n=1 Tax=Aldrovandia affinis TaxID=143900 RepID=A0AAD7RNA5_9TELE|nr:hypothetical protein AAFF_G00160780 [Aldrovandia affinis]